MTVNWTKLLRSTTGLPSTSRNTAKVEDLNLTTNSNFSISELKHPRAKPARGMVLDNCSDCRGAWLIVVVRINPIRPVGYTFAAMTRELK